MARPRRDDLFEAVRHQAARLLATIGGEIQRRENELQHLRRQAENWRAAIGKVGRSSTVRLPRARQGRPSNRLMGKTGRGGGRVSWDEVLGSVPSQFRVEDVLKHPGARAKGRSQIYAALSRWLAAGKIKRIAMGKYAQASVAGTSSVVRPKTVRKARRRRAKSARRGVAVKRVARRSKRSKRTKG